VLEPLAGYLQLVGAQYAEPASFAEGWNFGPLPTSHMTVQEVTEEVIRDWGCGVWQAVSQPEDHPMSARAASFHEDACLKLDITKAISTLRWRPLFSTSEAISETIRWYRQRVLHANRFDASEMCVQQIQAYTARAGEQGLPWAMSNRMPFPVNQIRDLGRSRDGCGEKGLRSCEK
jgi:CDP-glucose 4,6-dehydratase